MRFQFEERGQFPSTRRSVLLGALAAGTLAVAGPAWASAAARTSLSNVEALAFDMQGTVFDFYDPLVQAARGIGRGTGLAPDWAATLPGDWSGGAHDIIVEIAAGRRAWMSNTEIYREALPPLLARRGVADHLSEADRNALLAIWGKMLPWPDVAPGLTRLRRKFTLSTLTNASMAQMTALVKDNRLPFDEILTGELTRAFKPDHRVYQSAVDFTGFRPEQILMVSAHKWDLQASKRAGFKTAYVPRPLELGPGHSADLRQEAFIDVIARDMCDLADKLA